MQKMNSTRGGKLPSFWTMQIAGWLAYWLMIGIVFLPVLAPEQSVFGLFKYKLIRAVFGFALSGVLRKIYQRFGARLSAQAIFALVVVCSGFFGAGWTLSMAAVGLLTSGNFQFDAVRALKDTVEYSATLLAWSAIYFGWKYFQEAQREQENALRAAALANEAQLEMLRYQLNPHFLFNALNSIKASVSEDQARAETMVAQLSEFLRYSILHRNAPQVSLGAELKAARNYLAIEKTRFEDKLEIEFAIEAAAENFAVPSFLLNPLVENAVKHGFRTSAKPLKIRISAELRGGGGLILEVANTGKLQNVSEANGTKVGLENVRERLDKAFGGRGEFELRQDGDLVKARIEIKEKINWND